MSTPFYNPGEPCIPSVGVICKQSAPTEGAESGSILGWESLSGESLGDDNFGGDHGKASDDDLITAAQCGDQQAFVELCGRHSPLAKKKIMRILRNQEDAEDVLQDTLLRAYTHLRSFRRSCRFSTWLTTIGVNSALMLIRKRRARREVYASTDSPEAGRFELKEPIDRSLGPEGVYLQQQTTLLVRRAVARLHPRLRSVVNHFYGSEYSLEESAKALEISSAAAKSRLLRGRIRLRSSLARYGISGSLN